MAAPRSINTAELAILKTVIERGIYFDENRPHPTTQERDYWLSQANQAQVFGGCNCGCPSIELSPNTDDFTDRKILELFDTTQNVMVMLFIDDNQLSYLEFAGLDQEPVHLPKPEDLEDPTVIADE